MKIKELQINNRPRERLIKQGASSLSDIEILAILINTGTSSLSALDIANNLLNKYTLNELLYLDYDILIKEKGIKESKACKIIASFELAKRAIKISDKKEVLKEPKEIYNYLTPLYTYTKVEKVIVLLVDNKLRLIKDIELGIGDLNEVSLNIKNLISLLIKYDAYGFILSHNHPSGDTLPSKEDKILTNKLYKLTKDLGVLLLDHIIWGKDNYFSFLENHLLDFFI